MSKTLILEVGSNKVNMAQAFPLTLGDWKELEKLGLMTKDGAATAIGPDGVAKLLFYLISKTDMKDKVKIEDLDNVSLNEIGRVAQEVQEKMGMGEEADPT